MAVALAVALALLVGGDAAQRDGVRAPSASFYSPPAAVPGAPGRLIRSEQLVAGVPDGMRAWRILYTTTNGNGGAEVSSGTVLASTEPPGGDQPVIAVAHGTTGIVPACAPSLWAEPFTQGAAAALERVVSAGAVGVLSDYVGLGTAGPHPYLIGQDAARAVLDGVRAAHELSALELSDDVVVWGHSQGGHAALWVGIVAADYAPELELLGVAAMAPPTELSALVVGIGAGAVGKVVASYLAVSWAQVYPELTLDSTVMPGRVSLVRQIASLCFIGREESAALGAAERIPTRVLRPEALDGELGGLLRANSPTGSIVAPVLIAQGTADRLVAPQQQREFVADRCAEGQRIDYRTYPGLGHGGLVGAESPLTSELVAWTAARFARAAPTSSCAPQG